MIKPFVTALCLTLAPAVLSPAGAAEMPSAPNLEQLAAQAITYQSGDSAAALREIEALVRRSAVETSWRRPVELALVQLLGTNSTFEAKQFACKQLGIIGSKTALPWLAVLANHEETTGIACLALTTYPPGRADEILREALSYAHGKAEIQILNTLGDRRDRQAVRLLATAAASKDTAVAEAAIAALGKIGDDAAAKALNAVRAKIPASLQEGLGEASLRIAEGLLAAGRKVEAKAAFQALYAPTEPIAVRRRALAALLPMDADDGELRMIAVLKGTNAALRAIAIAHVPAVSDPSASSVFSTELFRLPPEEQALMLQSLARRADLDARLTIGVCVTSTQEVVRRAAVAAIGRIGDAWYVSMLSHALIAAKTPEERRAIENALVGLGGGVETDKAIADAVPHCSGVAGAAMMSAYLRRVGATAATPMMLAELKQNDPAMAKYAYRALGRTAGPELIGPILQTLVSLGDAEVRPDAQATVERILARIPEIPRRSLLLREAFAKAEHTESKCSLLGLLPLGADEQALAAAKSALSNTDPVVREAALRALADWPDTSAWDSLAAVYLHPDKPTLRWIAMRGMVRLVDEENEHPGPQFIEHYRQLVVGARNELDLKVILAALPGAAHPDALQLAVSMLANPSVRPEAELAIRSIAAAIKAKHPAAAEEALKKLETTPVVAPVPKGQPRPPD